MRLLALDTSGDACSAALLADGAVRQRIALAPRQHSELILEMLHGLLEEVGMGLAELDAIAFGRGPGSFTGVRIAVAVAQGVAFGAGLPTVPVSTLAALAQGEWRRSGCERVLAALDARMGEVYWGAFVLGPDGLMVAVEDALGGGERVCGPEDVPMPKGDSWWGVGPGWSAHGDILRVRLGASLAGTRPDAVCEAWDIALLASACVRAGEVVLPELARPVYLRDRVTQQDPRVKEAPDSSKPDPTGLSRP